LAASTASPMGPRYTARGQWIERTAAPAVRTEEALGVAAAINVLGQIAVTQAVLPQLRAARGRIVNLGAPSGRVAIPLMRPIGASKAALHLLNDALRMELRHQGISAAPGWLTAGDAPVV
jgi:NAD(P)-dependent dehydrogenase (short-subunit alcohol dehydrogenase family)